MNCEESVKAELDQNPKVRLLCTLHKEACYKCNPRVSERLDEFIAKIYGSDLTDIQFFKILDTLKEVFPEFNYEITQKTNIKYKCDNE